MKLRNLLYLLPFLLAALLYPWARTDAQTSGPSSLRKPIPPIKAELVASQRKDAPLGLTASDGTGLHLVALKAQAVLEGPLAFTELHLTFENPEDRVLEGRFQITLPDQAAISRLAMKIDDHWQEAEVVELQAARLAYEDFLHRRQDPALLEKAAGNEFSARIFPIPAKGRKEIIISYSQELADQSYRLPLQGLPRLGLLEVFARVASSQGASLTPETHSVTRENYLPEGDFVVSGGEQPDAITAGDYLVARVRPQLEAQTPAPVDNLLLLVDTSASRALGHTAQTKLVNDLLERLPALETLSVAAFDQKVTPLYNGPGSKFSANSLLDRQALGATDLNAALRWAAQQRGYSRLLVVTDGVSTAGSDELKSQLKSSSLQRLDVLLVGGIRDRERMSELVGSLPKSGLVLDEELGTQQIAHKLMQGVASGVDVSVENALWVWPRTLDNLQPGDERLVFAQMKSPQKTYRLSLGGVPTALEVKKAAIPQLLERQAIVAKISRLESLWKDAKESEKAGLATQIVELSTKHRVLSDKTALLVLETEQDYARFKIDRKALADILTVGKSGLELKTRDDIVVPQNAIATPGQKSRVDDGVISEGATTSNEAPALSARGRLPELETGYSGPAPTVSSADVRTTSVARPAPQSPRRELSIDTEVDDIAFEPPVPPQEEGLPNINEGTTGEPLYGPLLEITLLRQSGDLDQALKLAREFHHKEPGNVLALIALGECLEAKGQNREAARAYGSLIDLFPGRADLRRFAGTRLQSLGNEGLSLAVDTFGKAVEQRPDHVSSHRFLAMALARQGNYAGAFQALEKGLSRDYPDGRFRSYERILKDDLSIIGAAWVAKTPNQKPAIEKRLLPLGATLAEKPSLRFVLTWETDANDVDFHIRDAQEGHAFYSSPKLPSGGELYGDVTTGYGPECFAIPNKPNAFPYRLQIHYYSRGPMGYGMGQLEVLQHDGKGGILFEERPYIVMQDGAYVDLGIVEQPLQGMR